MKKILTLLAIVLAALTSCKEELVQYSISVDPVELSFNSAGGEDTVYVTSSAEWELFSESGWCHASSAGGNGDSEIVITVLPNKDSKSGRTATFTFVSGDKKATLTVTQEKKEYSISIEPKELVFNADGGEHEITVTSSDEWKVKGESDWCTLSSDSGNNEDRVTIIVDKYDNPKESRMAVFTFECGNKNVALTITQEKKEYSISIEPTELTFGAEGGEQEIVVTSSDEWEVTGESNWCYTSVASGVDGDTVNFSVEPYMNTEETRTAIYTFVCGDKEAVLNIEQEAKVYSISVEPTELTFIAAGEEKAVTVTSSDEWEFSSKEDWITASKQNGENNAIVKIIVAENYDPEIRTGVAIFRCGNKQSDIQITQEAKEYSVSVEPKELTFDANGGEKEVIVSSSDEWELTADCDWIQTSVSKGDNGTSVKITALFNNTSEQRTGSIVFTCGNKTAELKLTQEANNFSISIEPAELVFGPAGGEETVKITSSHKWTLTNNLDWITTTVSEGNNGDDIKITVTPNNTADSRSGIVMFTCGNKTSELLITQNPDDSPIIQFKDQYFFEAILEQVDANGDGQISEREASDVKRLSTVSRNAIRGMDELKYFTSLEHLELYDIINSALTFDLRCCTNLKTLITELPEQPTILLSGSQSLTSVDVSGGNYDFSNCTSLIDANCGGETLNFSGCSLLQNIEFKSTAKNINLTGCTSLQSIQDDGYITSGGVFDCSDCASLREIKLYSIQDVAQFNASGCSALEYFDVKFKYSYNTKAECNIEFKSCHSLSSCIIGGDDYYNICNINISSLQDCKNLVNLSLLEFNCPTINLGDYTFLQELTLEDIQQLETLDLSKNSALTKLTLDNVPLSSLDLSANTALKELSITDVPLSSLELKNNSSITSLTINETLLQSLDLKEHTALSSLDCSNNRLASLLLDGCSSLRSLHCENNNLQSLNVGDCQDLRWLSCFSNPISSLDISNCRQMNGNQAFYPVKWYIYGSPSITETRIYEETKCPLESLVLYRYNNFDKYTLDAIHLAYPDDIIFYAE